MYKKFIYGDLQLNTLEQGITIAASWAWGVSVIVGMQVFQEKGVEAFVIWAGANALTLALVGWLFVRVPPGALRLSDIIPRWAQAAYSGITFLIQFFSVLVNLTAIKTAFSMLGWDWCWLPFSILIFVGVFWCGFGHAVRGNILKYAVWMALLVAVFLGGNDFTITHSTSQDMRWGLYGALILFCAPILDQQMWQRKAAFNRRKISPFIFAAILFAAYMVLVGLVASIDTGGIIIPFIILLVASSTMASALSAVSCYGCSISGARKVMATVFVVAALCLGFSLSVLQIWVLYGSIRIPFALLAFGIIFWNGRENYI